MKFEFVAAPTPPLPPPPPPRVHAPLLHFAYCTYVVYAHIPLVELIKSGLFLKLHSLVRPYIILGDAKDVTTLSLCGFARAQRVKGGWRGGGERKGVEGGEGVKEDRGGCRGGGGEGGAKPRRDSDALATRCGRHTWLHHRHRHHRHRPRRA